MDSSVLVICFVGGCEVLNLVPEVPWLKRRFSELGYGSLLVPGNAEVFWLGEFSFLNFSRILRMPLA
jgi:hypothetical protein